MEKLHQYKTNIIWTGNKGSGTSHYTNYDRSHELRITGKPRLMCSSDAPFRGDFSKHNPEDFLLAALSSCHMLWYLHLCADAGVIVESYIDEATGIMQQDSSGGGKFKEVKLNPQIVVQNENMIDQAMNLHVLANQKCFIANSVNFEVKHMPRVSIR